MAKRRVKRKAHVRKTKKGRTKVKKHSVKVKKAKKRMRRPQPIPVEEQFTEGGLPRHNKLVKKRPLYREMRDDHGGYHWVQGGPEEEYNAVEAYGGHPDDPIRRVKLDERDRAIALDRFKRLKKKRGRPLTSEDHSRAEVKELISQIGFVPSNIKEIKRESLKRWRKL